MYKQYIFKIDGINAQYVGYTTGALWNGWECPAFEKEVAEKILASAESDAKYSWRYDEEIDTFEYTDSEGDPYEDCKGFEIEHNGRKLTVYSIGAWGWIWNKASEHTFDEMHVLMAAKLKALRDAAQALDMFWDYDIPDMVRTTLETDYPFDESFDEMACRIESWYDNFVSVNEANKITANGVHVPAKFVLTCDCGHTDFDVDAAAGTSAFKYKCRYCGKTHHIEEDSFTLIATPE